MILEVDLSLQRGESLALLGPSGSGKTTLLRLLAGLLPADRGRIVAFGRIWLDSAQNIELAPRHRRAGLVFQDYALFPNMSVRGNVRFALPKGRSKARADELLELVGLASLAERRPERLSGGQQQRLALARALAAEPELLLLDEPLCALDGTLRRELQNELIELRRRLAQTMIIVTHDPGEALRLAERAVLIEAGQVVADGLPARLFGLDAGTDDHLVLAGRVIGQEATVDGSLRYLIESEGRICRARAAAESSMEVGDTVLISAGEWVAQPLQNRKDS